jgi:hypothetical protein
MSLTTNSTPRWRRNSFAELHGGHPGDEYTITLAMAASLAV